MKNLKKTLSLFLALVMCLGLVNLSAFADTTEGGETVLCTKSEDCAATIHEEGCPKYETPAEGDTGDDDDANAGAGTSSDDVSEENGDDNGIALIDEGDDPVYVAQIGDQGYETLQAAIDAATENGTVTLLKTVKTDAALTVTEGKTVSLDLNGNTYQRESASGNYAVINYGTLTVSNGTIEGNKFGVYNNGTLNMSNVTVSSDNYTIDLDTGTTTIESCVITSNGMAIYTNGSCVADLTIRNSEVFGVERAFNQWGTGKIIAENTTFKSDNLYPLESNYGSVELRGCTVEGNFLGDKGTIKPDSNTVYGSDSWEKYAENKFDENHPIPETDYKIVVEGEERHIYVYSVDGLAWWANQVNKQTLTGSYTLHIEAEILELKAHTWEPINGDGSRLSNVTIQGKANSGTTIKNMKAWGYTYDSSGYPYGGGFFGRIAGGSTENVTIENLTFDNANVAIASDTSYYGNIIGIVIGQVYTGKNLTLRNINVVNSQVTGSGKVGGLVGQTNGETVLLENCKVEDTIVRGAQNCGGLIGLSMHPEKVTIKDCTANAKWEPSSTSPYVCFVGTADKDLEKEIPLDESVNVAGTFYKYDNACSYSGVNYPGLYAAWGDQYTSYELYFADKTPVGLAGIIGLCYNGELHTHTDLTGTRYVDNEDGVTHNLVCAGCGEVLKGNERHTFENNVCVKCGAEKCVAKNVDTGEVYTTLQLAVNAVTDNGTATIEMIDNSDLPAVIPAGKTITLNVQGFKLTNSQAPAGGWGNTVLRNYGTLTVNGDGMIQADAAKGSSFALYNYAGGTATLNGCTYQNHNGDYTVRNAGTMEINGAKLIKELNGSPSIIINIGTEQTHAKLTVNDCDIQGLSSWCIAIKNDDWGELEIIDGTFAAGICLQNSGISAKISGGTFINNAKGAARLIYQNPWDAKCGTALLTISGGDFYSVDADTAVIQNAIKNNLPDVLAVSGGTFFKEDAVVNEHATAEAPYATPYLVPFEGSDQNGNAATRWHLGYTVTFDSNEGSPVDSQYVVKGGTATAPNSTRNGYTLAGWRLEGATSNYDFTTPVTMDITLVAQWTQNSSGGGSSGGGSNPNPNPGGGGGGTNIEDEDPPLANVDGNLNTTDHFAYIIGRGENCVQPLENITRAEVATIFFRLLTEDFRVANWSTVSSFPDVEAGAWYATEIATAERAGILKGCDDGNMQPNRNITRAEFTVMAIRFLNGTIEDDGVGDFADTANHWAAKEIRLAAKAGWIKGYGNNFRPNDPITRAEAMTIINRMLDRVPGETFPAGVIEWEDNPKGAWYYADVMEATNGHDYEREEGSVVEKWTALTPYRDWIALEAEWTANNGASASAQ